MDDYEFDTNVLSMIANPQQRLVHPDSDHIYTITNYPDFI